MRFICAKFTVFVQDRVDGCFSLNICCLLDLRCSSTDTVKPVNDIIMLIRSRQQVSLFIYRPSRKQNSQDTSHNKTV